MMDRRPGPVSYCPECGGDLFYDIRLKRHVCRKCGLSVTQNELAELREKLRPSFESEDEKKKRRNKDYLDWWFSKKSQK